MSTLTIRNLPSDVVERLKHHARQHGRSMEQEVRDILSHRFASRSEMLDRVEASWSALPGKPSAAKVDAWIANARGGRPNVNAAVKEVLQRRTKRQGGKP
jgi:plasmid stability protein